MFYHERGTPVPPASERRGNNLKPSQRPLPDRPESGLDCLVCAMLAGQRHLLLLLLLYSRTGPRRALSLKLSDTRVYEPLPESGVLPVETRESHLDEYSTQSPSWGYLKVIFQRRCQYLAINAHEMAPRTGRWLQERGRDAPT